jgi:indole-3-glycerol phosphate synthase
MPLLLLNNYKLIIGALIALIITSLLTWVYLLESDLKVANADYKAIESALTAQSNIIESNRVDYERNLIDANKTNMVIQTRYKDRVKVIYQWGENNVTDCNSSMSFINHYSF